MRTTVDLDAELLRRVRIDAERRGVPFKDALAAALRRGLDELSTTVQRRRYRCPSHSMGRVNPGIDLDKALRIASELDDARMVRTIGKNG